jgi:hypothetical protein
MRFCISKAVITPDIPVFLQGFIGRSHKSEGIHDDIYARVTLLQSNKAVMLISLDICYADRAFVKEVKDELYKRYSLREDEILVTFTHTHSAVAVFGSPGDKKRSGYSISQDAWDSENKDYDQDIRYAEFIKKRIFELAEHCFQNLEVGYLHLGRGSADIGVNRRLMTPEGIKMLPNFNAKYDTDLFALKLTDLENRVKGIIFSYGCHPTAMSFDNYYISAEWCGFACSRLEAAFSGADVVFLQACAGDVKPKASAFEGRFKSCTFEETESIGIEIASKVKEVLEADCSKIDLDIRTCIKDIKLYLKTHVRLYFLNY